MFKAIAIAVMGVFLALPTFVSAKDSTDKQQMDHANKRADQNRQNKR
jgi:mannose/fructose/N-acetylgalactosamine-specific phosphotransferase system component IIC